MLIQEIKADNTKKDTILEEIEKIPLLSQSAAILLQKVIDPGHTVNDIKIIVENDQVLSTKVLSLINSAAYSLRNHTTSIEKAVAYLGDNNILSIALTSSAVKIYNKPLMGYECKEEEFWEHSLKTAIASKEIALIANGQIEPGLAYTCGILHDIGKSVISSYLINHTESIIEQLDNGSIHDYTEAEKNILGIDHAEVGYNIGKHWHLPEVFLPVLRWHHEPKMCDEEYILLCYIVHLGDIIAMLSGNGTGSDTLEYTLDTDYKKYLELSSDKFDALIYKVINEFEKIKSLFGVDVKEKIPA